MAKEKFTPLELAVLMFFTLNSFTSTIIINSYKNASTSSIIVSILISFIVGLVLMKKFFILQSNNFLKTISKIKFINYGVKLIFIISSITIALYATFNLSLIVKDVLLPNMSIKQIAIVFLIISLILSIKGIKSISIASNLMFIVYLIVSIVIVMFSILNIDPLNLLPINIPSASNNIITSTALTISPIFMLLTIPKENITNFSKYKKYIYISYSVFYVYIAAKLLFILAILGENYFAFINYPEIEILKSINVFNFFERLEEMLIINIFLQNIITVSLSLNYSSTVLNSIVNLKKKSIIPIIGVILIFILKVDVLPNSYLIIISLIFLIIHILMPQKKYQENY